MISVPGACNDTDNRGISGSILRTPGELIRQTSDQIAAFSQATKGPIEGR